MSRPTLSNFLNGKASLSADMATRLAKAFGADADRLLQLQSDHDRAVARGREAAIAVRAYAESAFAITAMQISAWAEHQSSRAELAVLLRRLVHTTGEALSRVDFPGHENSQRHGWDGVVTAGAATPWIPLGDSGWEFGVNEEPRRKAEGDYIARTGELQPAERGRTTFVFVTPRNWPGKNAWEAAKRAEGEWKDVRAFDASDLEQWIETSVGAQAWLSAALPLRAEGIGSLDAAWKSWSEVPEQPTPPLPKSLFQPVAEMAGKKLADWLARPPERPFLVAADSGEEALAALACACDAPAAAALGAGDRAVVVRSAEALSKAVAASNPQTMIVIASPGAEAAASGTHRGRHTVIVGPRSSAGAHVDVAVGLVEEAVFREALSAMGFDRRRVEQLAHESGLSRTVLRRRLSPVPAVCNPPWANDRLIARRVIPLMLVGHWNSKTEADRAVVADLSCVPYDEVEAAVADLVGMEDSPVWTVGEVRGVVSKVDALYAVAGRMTGADLERFIDVARVVLSETDPSLGLPEEKRWASGIYGKWRRHSGLLRAGLCETLVLLVVHGNGLLRERLGIDVEWRVGELIRALLTPLDGPTWQSQEGDLPRYAEAAPKVFLDILEKDLRSADPKVHALMKPAGSAPFSSPSRTGLLWALETLAWSPRWLPWVVGLLGRLSEIPLEDNWVNKPENSLLSIFRAWMPQTAASAEDRLAALEELVRRHPRVGWRVCLAQLQVGHDIGHYSARPRWRSDATAAGEPVTVGEAQLTRRRALDLVLAWPSHDEGTLGDLLENRALPPAEQEKVWDAVMRWAASGVAEETKATLRERIRRATMTLPTRRRRRTEDVPPRAIEAYDALTPTDAVLRHRWLFEQQWIHESAVELEADDVSFEARDRRVASLREDALRDVWGALGPEGILRLSASSGAAYLIGHHLARGVLTRGETEDVACRIAEVVEISDWRLGGCLSGLLAAMDTGARESLLERAVEGARAPSGAAARVADALLRCAPFGSETWAFVDRLARAGRTRYWRSVPVPPLVRESPDEVNRAIDELIGVERPRTAFNAAEMVLSKVTTGRLVRLLHEAATNRSEPTGQQQFRTHDISDAFEELSKRADIAQEELVRLEFLYLEALEHTQHGIKNLENAISTSPELFLQLLALAFKRNDGGEDPPELRPGNEASREDLAAVAYRALDRTKRLPGTEPDGSIALDKLRAWIIAARKLAQGYARGEIADSRIGSLLAAAGPGEDGVWPAEAVREILEEFGNDAMAAGLWTGRYNARGAVWRAAGGDQERELVARYREWSRRIANRHPFAARVLEDMAATYEGEAEWHDREEAVRRRVGR